MGHNKIVCVHTLLCMMSLVYLLLDVLAEHVLRENCVHWQLAKTPCDKRLAKEDLFWLMCVINESKYLGVIINDGKSFSKLLDDFKVGTERPKNIPAPLRNNTVFKPMREYGVQNPFKQGVKKVKEKLHPIMNMKAIQSSEQVNASATITIQHMQAQSHKITLL
jgi:hypothetical protein